MSAIGIPDVFELTMAVALILDSTVAISFRLTLSRSTTASMIQSHSATRPRSVSNPPSEMSVDPWCVKNGSGLSFCDRLRPSLAVFRIQIQQEHRYAGVREMGRNLRTHGACSQDGCRVYVGHPLSLHPYHGGHPLYAKRAGTLGPAPRVEYSAVATVERRAWPWPGRLQRSRGQLR